MFKSESSQSNQEYDENTTLLLTAAGGVTPVSELNAQNRAALCKTASVSHMQRNDKIKPENAHRWLMYLVEGSLTLYNGKDEVGTLNSRTPEALQPLFEDKSYQTVKTSSMAKVVKFGREQMDILLKEQQKNAISVVDIEVGELDNLLFDDIVEDIQVNKISLASYGESAAKILASLANSAVIPELADVIQSDPGLAAHVVLTANRSDGGKLDKTQTIRGAISRLGVEATVQTVTDLLRSNTMIAKNTVIEDRFRRYVQRTALASAICHVLAKDLPHLKADVAVLVALTSDIGELMVITYANKHPEKFDEAEALTTSIANLRGICSSWLLSTWDYPAEFVEASETARDWYRNLAGEISYTDLVTAALLIIQSEMPDAEQSSIPSVDNLLLARRLQQAGIDLKAPGNIIREATSRLVTVEALLKAG